MLHSLVDSAQCRQLRKMEVFKCKTLCNTKIIVYLCNTAA